MQLAACGEICGILGLPSFSSTVYEADDIIGTLAERVRRDRQDIEVHILSRDKDLAQLLEGDKDCLWDYNGNRKRFRADIVNEFGVHPEQFPDYLGLVGDSVDRISGVPGVGPVKAKEILQRFQSLEDVYLNLDKMGELPLRGAGRLADLLEGHRELAELSKVLATIVCDVEDPEESFSAAGLDTLQIDDIDAIELSSFLNTYKFSARDNDRIMSAARRISKS
jgi:5'-3' exonuclease